MANHRCLNKPKLCTICRILPYGMWRHVISCHVTETLCSCWKSVEFSYTTRRHTPKHSFLHIQLRENSQISLCKIYFAEFNETAFNLLATDFFFQILAHPVFKMWVIQKPNKVTLWNKWHFEEKNGDYRACLKYSVRIFVE